MDLNWLDNTADIDFSQAAELIKMGFGGDLRARFDRIMETVDIRELITELHGTSSNVISCPFHGRDSRPSLYVYPSSNSAFCFGCPPGQGWYGPVQFVAAKFGYTKVQALEWLERKYNLPIIDSDEEGEELNNGYIQTTKVLTFDIVHDAFIKKAVSVNQQVRSIKVFRKLAQRFFNAIPDEGSDPASPEELDKVLSLVKLLDTDTVDHLQERL